ncbi:MAG TPA: c-type cytochrome, partial [Verrucomicrobiae bacterium]|nr:c-type cytochrome [Verrucomicrobiae bacterium]
DTSGPYYQPAAWSETDKIAEMLSSELERSSPTEAAFLISEFNRHNVQTGPILASVIRLAEQNETLIPAALLQLSRADSIPAAGRNLLTKSATAPEVDVSVRAHAIMALTKLGDAESARALFRAMPLLGESADRDAVQARQAFFRSPKTEQQLALYQSEAAKIDSAGAPWADGVLLSLSVSKAASPETRNTARNEMEAAWDNPRRKVQLLKAVALAEHRAAKQKVIESLNDSDPAVAAAARAAVRSLRLEKELKAAQGSKDAEPLLSVFQPEEIISRAIKFRGDAKLGSELFARQTCNACHTVNAADALRGPFLGNIAAIYKRDELARAILLPNHTIAQGFATHHFEMKDGSEMDGFVVQEAADKITIRNVAAQEIQLKPNEIATRSKSERSLMPEGLAANLTLKEFASLLDYLQGIAP